MALTLGLICFSVAIIVPILAIIYARKAALRAKYRPYRPNKNNVSSNERRVANRHPRYKKLVGLLHGDRDAADRLSDIFGVDRAIEDLIRDRSR